MKRLVKHQPERSDSVVGFACSCSNSCGCSCACNATVCTCACTGTTAAFENQRFAPQQYAESNYANTSSGAYNTTYSGVSTNIVWG